MFIIGLFIPDLWIRPQIDLYPSERGFAVVGEIVHCDDPASRNALRHRANEAGASDNKIERFCIRPGGFRRCPPYTGSAPDAVFRRLAGDNHGSSSLFAGGRVQQSRKITSVTSQSSARRALCIRPVPRANGRLASDPTEARRCHRDRE
jgi:hypothetical protein